MDLNPKTSSQISIAIDCKNNNNINDNNNNNNNNDSNNNKRNNNCDDLKHKAIEKNQRSQSLMTATKNQVVINNDDETGKNFDCNDDTAAVKIVDDDYDDDDDDDDESIINRKLLDLRRNFDDIFRGDDSTKINRVRKNCHSNIVANQTSRTLVPNDSLNDLDGNIHRSMDKNDNSYDNSSNIKITNDDLSDSKRSKRKELESKEFKRKGEVIYAEIQHKSNRSLTKTDDITTTSTRIDPNEKDHHPHNRSSPTMDKACARNSQIENDSQHHDNDNDVDDCVKNDYVDDDDDVDDVNDDNNDGRGSSNKFDSFLSINLCYNLEKIHKIDAMIDWLKIDDHRHRLLFNYDRFDCNQQQHQQQEQHQQHQSNQNSFFYDEIFFDKISKQQLILFKSKYIRKQLAMIVNDERSVSILYAFDSFAKNSTTNRNQTEDDFERIFFGTILNETVKSLFEIRSKCFVKNSSKTANRIKTIRFSVLRFSQQDDRIVDLLATVLSNSSNDRNYQKKSLDNFELISIDHHRESIEANCTDVHRTIELIQDSHNLNRLLRSAIQSDLFILIVNLEIEKRSKSNQNSHKPTPSPPSTPKVYQRKLYVIYSNSEPKSIETLETNDICPDVEQLERIIQIFSSKTSSKINCSSKFQLSKSVGELFREEYDRLKQDQTRSLNPISVVTLANVKLNENLKSLKQTSRLFQSLTSLKSKWSSLADCEVTQKEKKCDRSLIGKNLVRRYSDDCRINLARQNHSHCSLSHLQHHRRLSKQSSVRSNQYGCEERIKNHRTQHHHHHRNQQQQSQYCSNQTNRMKILRKFEQAIKLSKKTTSDDDGDDDSVKWTKEYWIDGPTMNESENYESRKQSQIERWISSSNFCDRSPYHQYYSFSDSYCHMNMMLDKRFRCLDDTICFKRNCSNQHDQRHQKQNPNKDLFQSYREHQSRDTLSDCGDKKSDFYDEYSDLWRIRPVRIKNDGKNFKKFYKSNKKHKCAKENDNEIQTETVCSANKMFMEPPKQLKLEQFLQHLSKLTLSIRECNHRQQRDNSMFDRSKLIQASQMQSSSNLGNENGLNDVRFEFKQCSQHSQRTLSSPSSSSVTVGTTINHQTQLNGNQHLCGEMKKFSKIKRNTTSTTTTSGHGTISEGECSSLNAIKTSSVSSPSYGSTTPINCCELNGENEDNDDDWVGKDLADRPRQEERISLCDKNPFRVKKLSNGAEEDMAIVEQLIVNHPYLKNNRADYVIHSIRKPREMRIWPNYLDQNGKGPLPPQGQLVTAFATSNSGHVQNILTSDLELMAANDDDYDDMDEENFESCLNELSDPIHRQHTICSFFCCGV